ncbi:galactokinase family protein [Algoriphagus halophilus]|uniref:galactokinase family protein n=1 Tax=Algoriphagus halophilus TaxID=226505 RepID=UPI00358F072D
MNLIGEHTDYQEGFVFPAAVSQGIWVAVQENDSISAKSIHLILRRILYLMSPHSHRKKGIGQITSWEWLPN